MEPNQVEAPTRARQGLTVTNITILLLILPVLVDLLRHTTPIQKRIFAYTTPDTFYYLTIARNIGLHGKSSFDGEHLTNGYHPLWQFMTAIPYAFRLPGANSPWILAYLLVMAITLQSLALGLWSRIFRRPDGSLSWFFAFFPAGVFALLSSPYWLVHSEAKLSAANAAEGAQPVYGSLWAGLNGMETSLVLACFAWIAWLFIQGKPLEKPARFGFALILFTFARLDHIFISLPILIGACIEHMRQEKTWRARLRNPALAFAAFAGPIVAYLLLNYFFVGSAAPTSGRLKSTFPFFGQENFDITRKYFNHLLLRDTIRLDDHWRVMQLVWPIVAALTSPLVVLRVRFRRNSVALSWARPGPRRGQFLLLSAVGVLALGWYNFTYVLAYGVGHWYFPVSCFFMSLLTLHAIERIRYNAFARTSPSTATSASRREKVVRYGVPLLATAITGSLFFAFHRTSDYHLRYANFAVDWGADFRDFLQKQKVKLIDCDDGILGWVGEAPSMSGTGLALDLEAIRARQSPTGLMPLAMNRGYNHAGTLVYVDNVRPKSNSPSEIGKWMNRTGAFTQLGPVKNYDWRIVYQTPKREFVLMRATPALPEVTK